MGEVPALSPNRPLSQRLNLYSSALESLITAHVRGDAREAPDPAVSPQGPATPFYGNCFLAAVFIFFPSFCVCCIYLNITIKSEVVIQSENSDIVITSRLNHLL